MIGIYCFTNKINNKKYIGQSRDIENRIKNHHKIEYNNPSNGCYNTKFYQALRKYGFDNFTIEILEECPIEKLNEREIYWIEYYNSYKEGYNSTLGGTNLPDSIKSKETEEKRAKTREKNKSLQAENHPRARLTNEEVYDLRLKYATGYSAKELWEQYKELYPKQEIFNNILTGRSYKSVKMPDESISNKKIGKTGKRLFTHDQIIEIRKRYENGEKISSIAKTFGVCYTSIERIVKYKSYKNVK